MTLYLSSDYTKFNSLNYFQGQPDDPINANLVIEECRRLSVSDEISPTSSSDNPKNEELSIEDKPISLQKSMRNDKILSEERTKVVESSDELTCGKLDESEIPFEYEIEKPTENKSVKSTEHENNTASV